MSQAVAAVELERAVAARGSFVLGPVTLSLAPGSTVAVLGPNGAGKSTLLDVMAGALPIRSGHAKLAGDDAAALAPLARAKRVAVLRQPARPAFSLQVLELVLQSRWASQSGWRFASPEDDAAARRGLDAAGAAHLAGRDVRSLSQGELQRVHLAGALARDVPLVLLDEPTANLDLAARARLIRWLASSGEPEARPPHVTAVVVTHDLALASAADRVVVLSVSSPVAVAPPLAGDSNAGPTGSVHADGTPAEMLVPGVLEAVFGVSLGHRTFLA